MSLSFTNLVCLVVPLILLEGFFSGSEIALLSADKLKLKKKSQQGDRGASLALELARHPERILSTTLLMTCLCVITVSALIEIYCVEAKLAYPDMTAILTTSPLIVLFGELLPKVAYQKNATHLARWIAYPVYWTFWIFYPITRIIASYTPYHS
jgi:putative hemolysin